MFCTQVGLYNHQQSLLIIVEFTFRTYNLVKSMLSFALLVAKPKFCYKIIVFYNFSASLLTLYYMLFCFLLIEM